MSTIEYEYRPENCKVCDGKGWGGGEETDGETCPGCGLAGEEYRAESAAFLDRRQNTIIRTTNREDLRTHDRERGRYYWWETDPFISTTNAIKAGLPAPALMYWAPRVVAEHVADNLADVNTMAERMDRNEFITYLKNQPWQARDKAGDIGTLVHDLAEDWTLGRDIDLSQHPEAAQAKLRQFIAFMEQLKPDVYAIEGVTFNRTHRYAGAFDFILDVNYPDGMLAGRYIVDVKTGSGIYAEAALQQTAYKHGEFIAVGTDEVPMPEVDGAFCLHLTQRGWKLIPVVTSDSTFDAFLSCLETARWVHNEGPGGKEQSVGIPYLSSNDE